jgi:hypothetical protein
MAFGTSYIVWPGLARPGRLAGGGVRQRQTGPTLPGPPSTNRLIGQRKDKNQQAVREQGCFLMAPRLRRVRRDGGEPEYS